MKHTKDRVIALDYFRGICILMVILNHSWTFSMPIAYLSGAGGLWTSAAELFFLLSGITLMIVRGKTIKSDFGQTARKIWRRAGIIYLLNILLVSTSICLAYILPQDVVRTTLGIPPATQGLSLLWQILTFHYSIGLASFLMYYSVFLVFAPFALYAILSRLWPVVLSISAMLFLLVSSQALSLGAYTWFGLWQFYFVAGIVVARFRVPILNLFYKLSEATIGKVTALLATATAASIAISALLAFNIFPFVNRLVADGWLPVKARSAYLHLLNHENTINLLLRDGRMGVLRPLASILFLTTGYLLYQRYKEVLLKRTGKFINAMGRDSLWIFAAQAVAIPVAAALPVPRNFMTNLALTGFLIFSMWSVTKRRALALATKNYLSELKVSYSEAKSAYIYRSEERAEL